MRERVARIAKDFQVTFVPLQELAAELIALDEDSCNTIPMVHSSLRFTNVQNEQRRCWTGRRARRGGRNGQRAGRQPRAESSGSRTSLCYPLEGPRLSGKSRKEVEPFTKIRQNLFVVGVLALKPSDPVLVVQATTGSAA